MNTINKADTYTNTYNMICDIKYCHLCHLLYQVIWSAFADSIEAKLDAKLHEYGERLRNSPTCKRSLFTRSEDLTPYGFLDTIKDAVNGMIETGVNIKEKIVSLMFEKFNIDLVVFR